MCHFFFKLTNGRENARVKTTFAESFHATVLHSAIKAERRRKKENAAFLKVGGLGCHSMVTFCVEHHYDNEHSFSVVRTLPFNVLF